MELRQGHAYLRRGMGVPEQTSQAMARSWICIHPRLLPKQPSQIGCKSNCSNCSRRSITGRGPPRMPYTVRHLFNKGQLGMLQRAWVHIRAPGLAAVAAWILWCQTATQGPSIRMQAAIRTLTHVTGKRCSWPPQQAPAMLSESCLLPGCPLGKRVARFSRATDCLSCLALMPYSAA